MSRKRCSEQNSRRSKPVRTDKYSSNSPDGPARPKVALRIPSTKRAPKYVLVTGNGANIGSDRDRPYSTVLHMLYLPFLPKSSRFGMSSREPSCLMNYGTMVSLMLLSLCSFQLYWWLSEKEIRALLTGTLFKTIVVTAPNLTGSLLFSTLSRLSNDYPLLILATMSPVSVSLLVRASI